VQRTVVSFEDDAMNTLWTRHDGAQLLQDIATTMLLTGTSPRATAGQRGQTTTTAADVATFLTAVEDVLDPADAATVLGWMRSATATAADGFVDDGRVVVLLGDFPAATSWAQAATALDTAATATRSGTATVG
jgi:hypothetical protein